MIIISVLNEDKGGVGKTTISVGIASALTRMGHSVLAADLDRQKHLSKWFGVKGKVNIHHLWSEAFAAYFDAEDKDTVFDTLASDSAISRSLVEVKGEGFYMIPGSELMGGIELTGSTQRDSDVLLTHILRHPALEAAFDFCVIDGAPAARYLNESALMASDGVIVPLKMGMLDLEGTKLTVRRILEAQSSRNPNLQLYGVIANDVRGRSPLTNLVLDQAAEQTQIAAHLLNSYIPHSEIYGQLPAIKASPFTTSNNDLTRKAANPFVDLLAEVFERQSLYGQAEIEKMKRMAMMVSGRQKKEVVDAVSA